MNDDIALLSDDEGIVLIGEPGAIERFLASAGLASRELDLRRLRSVGARAAMAVQAGSEVITQSGRWVKLSEESARLMKQCDLMAGPVPGLKRAQFVSSKGLGPHVQIVKGTGIALTNPATLTAIAGLMQQQAMQHRLEEIADYLSVIDAKVDEVLRAQKDAALAELIGAASVVDEAMIVRERTGRVLDVTWSKVQGAALTIATGQAYALRRLDAIAESVESASTIGDLLDVTRRAKVQAAEWLQVLGRCLQLQESLGVLELDRVLDAEPDELDTHREALAAARQHRMNQVTECTRRLLARMDAAAGRANSKVLLNPVQAPAAVAASNEVTASVREFSLRVGAGDAEARAAEVRRWMDAATDVRDRALVTGAKGADVAKNVAQEAVVRARSMTGVLSGGLRDRARRLRGEADPSDGGSADDL